MGAQENCKNGTAERSRVQRCDGNGNLRRSQRMLKSSQQTPAVGSDLRVLMFPCVFAPVCTGGVRSLCYGMVGAGRPADDNDRLSAHTH